MSKYMKKKTCMTDKAQLVRAFETKMPRWEGHLIISDEPQVMYGYQGDDRTTANNDKDHYSPKCEIIAPGTGSQKKGRGQNIVGSMSNDIGAFLDTDGTYTIYVSQNEESQGFGDEWKCGVITEYAKDSWESHISPEIDEPIQSEWQKGEDGSIYRDTYTDIPVQEQSV